MIRRPPRSTRTDTLFPYTTLVRSQKMSGKEIGIVESQNVPAEKPVIILGHHSANTDLQPEKLGVEESVIRSEEHTSELQSLMRISYAVLCLKKKITHPCYTTTTHSTYEAHYHTTTTSYHTLK